jgi:hypothetical protein
MLVNVYAAFHQRSPNLRLRDSSIQLRSGCSLNFE